MERFNELRNEWIEALKTLKSLSTQTLYFLLEPDNDSKFFESVDSFKECVEKMGHFEDFQMLAIEYLLEYKKQNKPKITTEPYKPGTGTWPFLPLDNEQIQKYPKPNTLPKDPFSPFGPVITYSSENKNNVNTNITSSVANIPYFAPEHGYTTTNNMCITTKENKKEEDKQYKSPSELTVITHCLDCDCFDHCDDFNLCSHHEILAEIDGNALVKCAKNNLKKEVKNKSNDSNHCQNCSFYDDYDMCLNAENFGSITKERIINCNKNNLKRQTNK